MDLQPGTLTTGPQREIREEIYLISRQNVEIERSSIQDAIYTNVTADLSISVFL
jgi:hypothetical protein